MTRRVLVTGFGAFGPHAANPTEALVHSLAADEVGGAEIHTAVLPVNYDAALVEANRQVELVRPEAVILCGLYAGRQGITVEAVAVNVRDTPTHLATDTDGPPEAKPVDDGPDGLFATLPVRDIVRSVERAEIPVSLSYTAGTYVCNSTMYGVLNQARRSGSPRMAGFIHFPASSETAVADPSVPTLPLDLMRRALLIAIETTVGQLERS
jgi:pyroglutamyl-peptidase